jgi:hypothetical protein
MTTFQDSYDCPAGLGNFGTITKYPFDSRVSFIHGYHSENGSQNASWKIYAVFIRSSISIIVHK